MTEVYPEHFAEPCPADRIVAPHVRRMLLELLEADVEVIDALPLLLAGRDGDPEPLYQPADPHWGPRGQAIVARAVASRLKRYDFVAAALNAPPTFLASQGPYPPASSGASYQDLNPEQRRRAEAVHPRTYLNITNLAGGCYWSSTSPVVLIGDSYNGGFNYLLGKEINIPPYTLASGGQTTGAFSDFLRDPDLLQHCKVVVWLVNAEGPAEVWPLPRPIRDALERPAHD
jgi:hypothetical protein